MRTILRRFVELESSSGILLFAATLLALVLANSPLAKFHQFFVLRSIFIINDGLMAIFFLLVGLELKRELFVSNTSFSRAKIFLPAIAALGGMLVPAIVFWFLNQNDGIRMQGITTPVATDIAFALGVLSLFGKKIPNALKLFLLALAIYDDLGAIVIIAFCYTSNFSFYYLLLSGLILLALFMLNKFSINQLTPYLLLGAILWECLFLTGIHPTMAGVLLALSIPSKKTRSNAAKLEERIHPYVAYGIMPLFAFANAGLSLSGISMNIFTDSLVLGILLGLFLGKQIGVMLFTWIALQFSPAKLPEKTTWALFYGMSILCGIGFTMSLFLGTLSFQSVGADYIAKVQMGVMSGSLVSAIFGAVVLIIATKTKNRT